MAKPFSVSVLQSGGHRLPTPPGTTFPLPTPRAGSLGGSTLDPVAQPRVRQPPSPPCAAAGGRMLEARLTFRRMGRTAPAGGGPGASVCSTLTSSEGQRAERRQPGCRARGPRGSPAVPRPLRLLAQLLPRGSSPAP